MQCEMARPRRPWTSMDIHGRCGLQCEKAFRPSVINRSRSHKRKLKLLSQNLTFFNQTYYLRRLECLRLFTLLSTVSYVTVPCLVPLWSFTDAKISQTEAEAVVTELNLLQSDLLLAEARVFAFIYPVVHCFICNSTMFSASWNFSDAKISQTEAEAVVTELNLPQSDLFLAEARVFALIILLYNV
ncbi:hypothetical protein J6590_081054 [Homalodisca vitripennis]|nr:hypothetical protein J6590_081054 [Homalodisca vitripennis]